MTPQKQRSPRHVVDASSGLVLVYPDTLSLHLVSEREELSSTTLTLKATLEASAQDLSHFAVAREIRLTDTRFTMSAPEDKNVMSFDFVRVDAALRGSIVMVVRNTEVQTIKTALATNSQFLSPAYRGNSEEYSALITVASASLTENEVDEINSVALKEGFAQALLSFIKKVGNALENSEYALDLVNKGLSEQGDFSIVGQDRRWTFELSVPLQVLKIDEIVGTVRRVTGGSKEVQISWRE